MGGLTCKVRHFMALVISVALTSFILSLYNNKPPAHTLQDIVTRTHKQFETLKENLQSVNSKDTKLDVEDKYSYLLGFSRNPAGKETTQAQKFGLDPSEVVFANGTVPILIVTSVIKGQLLQLTDFITNVQSVLPLNPIVVWNTEYEASPDDEFSLSLKQTCNSSLCSVKRFNFEDYPEHVKDLSLRAYRPLILQTMLDADSGCVLWLDIDRRFIAQQSKLNLSRFLDLANSGGSQGIVGWPSGHPTSSLTHPKMFPFFDTTVENFFFHRMIDPSQLLLCKTDHLKSKVMKPWVACSLKKDCITPFGAQSGGCRFDKKPLYRYSGCHAYDSAALNVALGIAFPIHQPYISRAPLTRPVQLLLHNSTTL